MKKLNFLLVLAFLTFVSSKVNATPFSDGEAFGAYVVSTYVSPDLPPESDFVSITQSNSTTVIDGITYYIFDTIVGGIDEASYANAVRDYSYQNGILQFYYDYLETTLTNAGMPESYIQSYLSGYMSRMRGI